MRVAAFCRPLRPVLLLMSLPRSRSPVVGVLGLCWMLQDVPFARQRRPVVGGLGLCWLLPGSFDCFCGPHTSVLPPPPRPQGWGLRWRRAGGGQSPRQRHALQAPAGAMPVAPPRRPPHPPPPGVHATSALRIARWQG